MKSLTHENLKLFLLDGNQFDGSDLNVSLEENYGIEYTTEALPEELLTHSQDSSISSSAKKFLKQRNALIPQRTDLKPAPKDSGNYTNSEDIKAPVQIRDNIWFK